MDSNSDPQAQKVFAEIGKLQAEEEEVRLRISEFKENKSRPWWRKSTFVQILATGITGITFLGFYVTYSLVPALKIENTELRIENLETKERLMKEKAELERTNQGLLSNLEELKQKYVAVARQLEMVGRPQDARAAIASAQNTQSAINQLNARNKDVSSRTTVFIQIATSSSMTMAKKLQETLSNEGYSAPGIEVVGNDVSPARPQIRYFYRDQEGPASELLALIRRSNLGDFEAKYVKGLEAKAARNVLEVWFQKNN
jgi:hypothetical protein